MLTSFFGKSNPINYLIIAVLILVGYFASIFKLEKNGLEWSLWLENIGFAIVSVFLMLLLDFIIRKNNLTKNNTFGILLFSCFLLAFPPIFLSHYVLIASLFLFLALRRILSFRTEKDIEKKILDASIWITFASFFYFWSLLFFLILYFAMVQRRDINYKQLLIPIVGFAVTFILAVCYYLLVSDSVIWLTTWRVETSFDFSSYNQIRILLPITVIIALLVWAGIARFGSLASLQKKDRPNAIVILFSAVVSMVIALASPEKTGAEALFTFGPLVIIITNYIEIKKEFWFKEVLLWLVVLLPIIVFIL
ncbi:MAG: hypothetical protein ACI83B_004072 [Sediminicola sp.]|jgi:hypothetical protein|tara:strand:+ start:3437 stop:4360 length:924 start_codon:yes stop_codon:yes gene_type:complete